MTIKEAVERLDEMAQDAENENYHSLAGEIWATAHKLESITQPTYVLVVSELGSESFTVTP